MKHYYLFLILISANLVHCQIPKIEYEYISISKSCICYDFGPKNRNEPSPTISQISGFKCTPESSDFISLGKEGWELVTLFEDVRIRLEIEGLSNHYYGDFIRTFIFKRSKPLDEKEFYAKLNSVASAKVDSSMAEIKKFIVETLNKATKQLFSAEYESALKESILAQIRGEMKEVVEDVINATKQK